VAGWLIWATASVLLLVAGAYSSINFVAAIDLGYDSYPGGKAIIQWWFYGALASFGGALLTAAITLNRWLAWRRQVEKPEP
jgi:hypothetical protein